MNANPASPDFHFPGHDKLIAALDAAVSSGDEHAITAALRNTLCEMIRDREVQLPSCVHQPVPGHYARRELYRSPDLGYSVVAMTWGPGQGTPVHDHAGRWCVEGVWDGELEISQYELLETQGERFRFENVGCIRAGQGSTGSLIPPHEYHTIRNTGETVAVSLHIYQAAMESCCTFEPREGGWYERTPKALCTDTVQ